MSNVDPTRLVTDLIAGERLTTPTVKTIEPEVRSGGFSRSATSSSMVRAREKFNSSFWTATSWGRL